MNFFPSTNRSFKLRAFTLIELLVVITIIAVLAGLLLPVTQKVLENSRKVSCKSTESQIISSVNSFQTEYGQYPVPVSAGNTPTPTAGAATDTTYGIGSNNHNQPLFDVLRNLETGATIANTRHIVYFESKNVKSVTTPRDGFILTGAPKGNPNGQPVVTLTTGDLVDPWGNMYCVRIDTGYTNAVKNPYNDATVNADDVATTTPTATDTSIIRTGVISWSIGNDGILGTVAAPYTPTPGDDVVSWQ